MDLPQRGGALVKLTSLSALIGQGLHGSAPSGQGFGHARGPLPPHVTALAKKAPHKDFAWESEKKVLWFK